MRTYYDGGEQAYRRRIDVVSKKTGIVLIPNKRNSKWGDSKKHRSRAENLEIARMALEVDYPNGSWRNKEGRPKLEQIVRDWQAQHPDGRKADCIKDTGLSKPTVYKWWRESKQEGDRNGKEGTADEV